MTEFEDFVRKEREELSRKRDELLRERDDIDRRVQEIDREFEAVDAYERVKTGKAAGRTTGGSRRRTGIRQNVLDVVRRNPGGISRAQILQEMRVKGDKRAEQSISNALSNLKKQGAVKLEQGAYTSAD